MKRNAVLLTTIIIAILLSTSLQTTGQSLKISGQLKTTDGTPIPGAAVTLRTAIDSQLVKGTVSDSTGNFLLTGISSGNYLLQAYGPMNTRHSQLLQLTGKDLHLSAITIHSDQSVNLKEVVVDAHSPFLKRDLDRLTVDIEHSIYANGENAMRLFNVIPEVQIDAMGSILFRGSEKVTVYVDNRKIQLTGQQLLNYLKSIPSESIKSYEVRAVAGAQYDADNSGAVINILLKNDYKYGLSGSAGAEYQYTRYSNYSAWLALNYRIGRFTFQTSASGYMGTQFDEQTEIQYYKNTQVYTAQNNHTVNKNISYGNFKIGLDYKINDRQVIGVNYEGTHFPYEPTSTSVNNFSTGAKTSIDSTVHTGNQKHIRQSIQQANIFYRNRLDKKGSTLDIGYSYVSYDNNYNSAIETKYTYPTLQDKKFADSLYIDNPLTIHIHTANIDLEQILNNSWTLNIGGKYNASSTDNNISYFNELSAGSRFDSLRSNHFLYDEKIFAFYGSIAKKWTTWSFKLGLRTENTQYNGHSSGPGNGIANNQWGLFPTLFLQRSFTSGNALTLAASRSISRPSYQLLNPFEDIQNPFYIEKGNPALLPYYSNALQLSYLLHSTYNFTLGYKHTSKAINQVYHNYDAVIISTYDNVNNADDIFVSVSIPIHVAKWWDISSSATLRYVKLAINEGGYIAKDKFSQDGWISNRFKLPAGFYAELVGRYGRNKFLGIYDWKPQGSIDLNFKKSLLHDKFTATLNFADPFNLKRIGWEANEVAFTRNVTNRIPTRYFSIGLSYNLSKGKKEANRENVQRNDNDEVDRLNK
ncbi:outer membrane beta-barrel family protein [Chitinophaga sp. Cy-1792]|uniref:outer membrane beta-barrel family protein n=1 Tax=Chitinophaga sp. Cy-1792 TaxID=2608339 RepID=UPI0014240726|nr:outer membrane beta-barrel family protein [Chitinophaga sp. Cy-1792]NIG55008.1 outer membrane beta-barrel protein [Chitinophaga sp. Cy-1792]